MRKKEKEEVKEKKKKEEEKKEEKEEEEEDKEEVVVMVLVLVMVVVVVVTMERVERVEKRVHSDVGVPRSLDIRGAAAQTLLMDVRRVNRPNQKRTDERGGSLLFVV
ncbi:hypothetical protein HZH66_011469 [Vespula vulgaris]|uniref:Uncharacterized protein n=1 Tax=Vespula vulgaris TaxID=7454 RepID=A0A834MVL6_VESVU|nr:hypothetical protein HZH66_011469 [Vespula vulgaris]